MAASRSHVRHHRRLTLLASSALSPLALLFAAMPAMAQTVTVSGGDVIYLQPAQAQCLNQPACYLVTGVGSTLNSNGHTVHLQTTGASGDRYAAQATNGGTINLTDGGTIAMNAADVGAGHYGLWISNSGTINGNNLVFTTGTGGIAVAAFGSGGGAAQVTLSGTTRLTGTGAGGEGILGFRAVGNALVKVEGPVQVSDNVQRLADAGDGGRVELNGGGTLTANIVGQAFVVGGVNGPGTILVNGLTANWNSITDTSVAYYLFQGGRTQFTDSTFTGATSAGLMTGIFFDQTQNAANLATLDNSRITIASAGNGIRASGGTGTVTLTNNSVITGFGMAADSLARVTGFNTLASLTLNATDSTLTGNVLVDAPGAGGNNAFAANLAGTATWTGNLASSGASTASVGLTGTSSWTGLATNATNVTVGAGTTWNVTGDSTLTGVLTNSGTVATAAGAPITVATGGVTLTGIGIFDTVADMTLTGVVAGAGALTKNGTGSMTMTGDNTYTGPTNVNAGTLIINGNQAGAQGLVTVNTGATLAGGEGAGAGSGTIGGSVVINGGTLLSQDSTADGINKVTINGSLTVQNGANLNYVYGLSPNGNHDALMVEVGGTVNLNGGVVNVTNNSGVTFDPGIYGLIHGTTNGTGLTLGSVTPADPNLSLQITADRVNLYNNLAPAGTYNFWDGNNFTANNVVNGGTGIWQAAAGSTNWTEADGSVNGGFTDSSFAIFMTTGGTVTVDNSVGAINVDGMQFAVDGYTVQGDPITLVGTGGQSIIRVGDGSSVSAGYTATISSQLTGASQLVKSDLGTLVLSGNNTYTLGTVLDAGVLQVASDCNLGCNAGAPVGDLTFDGGTLRVTGTSFTSTPRAITWGAAGGGFDIADAGNTFTVSQVLGGTGSGTDSLTKLGAGTLLLTGANTYSGGTMITAGTLAVGDGGTLGTGGVANNSILQFANTGALGIANVISGTGSVTQTGTGTTTLTGANTYSGGTTIAAGTLAVGDGGALGTGGVANNSILEFANTGALGIANVISGTGVVTQAGTGTTTLTGANTYSGGTTITAGTLAVGDGGALGTGGVLNNSILRFANTTPLGIANVITGTGSVIQSGTGTTTLTGDSSYTGGTTISAGTLQLGNNGTTGSITGDVDITALAATLAFNRSDTYSFDGVISGAGGVAQNGSGTTILTATNTYTGPTNINNGTLQVDGSLASSPVNVNAMGTLSGFGTLSGTVNNLGNIMPGHGDAAGALTLTGPYNGQGGRLTINTALAGDTSPTSQLVLSGPTASATGNTNVFVNNRGGLGGQTGAAGIPIIVATGGATTTASAFALGNRVAAGLYDYQLFRGPDAGGTPDETNSWYLRSHIAGPGPSPIPLFRPEGAMYGAMASLGRELMRSSIGTFHDFNGDEAVLRGSQGSGRGWGRVFGEAIEQKHGGLLSPSFKGRAYGFQSGVDLWQSETPDGFRDRFGIFMSYARATGDVNGFALGIVNASVGDVGMDSLGGGAYWTRMTPTDGYIEARFIGAHYSGDGTTSVNRANISVSGKSFAGSLEAGQPFNFGNGIVIEPQAQVIYQYLDMDGRDPFATLTYDTPNALYARVGLRASSDSFFGFSNVRPYLKANIWQDVVGADKVAFSAVDVVDTNFRATALEVGGGIVAQLTPAAAVWGMVDYTTDITGSQERQIIRGNAGMKVTW